MATELARSLSSVTDSLPGGGESRPGQLEMARAVGRSIETGRHLVVMAGTGTGKSLAYLVPAVLSGRRVVVATATKALQDQLAGKDLPALADALGVDISFAVLKGRNNYLCAQAIAEIAGAGRQTTFDASSIESGWEADEQAGTLSANGRRHLVDEVRSLIEWSTTTHSGDRAELDFEPSGRAWQMVSVGPSECPGWQRCPKGSSCFAEGAREAAALADVVVVNTALYGAHLASGGVLLPEHDVAIFDEAHQLAEIMTDSLGAEVSPGRLKNLASTLRSVLSDQTSTATDLSAAADRLTQILASLIGTSLFCDNSPRDEEGWGRSRERRVTRAAERELAAFIEDELVRLDLIRQRVAGGSQEGDEGAPRARALSAVANLAADLARMSSPEAGEVLWVEGTERNPSLRLSPIEVGDLLGERLWGAVTGVLTSATITSTLVDQVGLAPFAHDVVSVESPFDYRTQALLYVPVHLPERRSEGFDDALTDELCALIEAAGGRTLALFTSRRGAEQMAERLASRLEVPIATQWDAPKARLIEEFVADESMCLFATMSFWQGVDVPGKTLSLVTLDRLPFPRPDDPLMMARRDLAGTRAFFSVDLPRAATLLAQGAGRLIRAKNDRGVVAVCDTRLATARYRSVLLDALPPMKRTTDQGEVIAFLREIALSSTQ